jgi:adenylosuccinate synthase
LPTEHAELAGLVREHNATNAWQGAVRYGWFDAVLARYALALTPELDALVLTHVDALARREQWSLCNAYLLGSRSDDDLVARSRDGRALELSARADTTLERQSRLGNLLRTCKPALETIPALEAEYVRCIEERLDRAVNVLSRGPTAADVEIRAPSALELLH